MSAADSSSHMSLAGGGPTGAKYPVQVNPGAPEGPPLDGEPVSAQSAKQQDDKQKQAKQQQQQKQMDSVLEKLVDSQPLQGSAFKAIARCKKCGWQSMVQDEDSGKEAVKKHAAVHWPELQAAMAQGQQGGQQQQKGGQEEGQQGQQGHESQQAQQPGQQQQGQQGQQQTGRQGPTARRL